jgi:hypothetical protein
VKDDGSPIQPPSTPTSSRPTRREPSTDGAANGVGAARATVVVVDVDVVVDVVEVELGTEVDVDTGAAVTGPTGPAVRVDEPFAFDAVTRTLIERPSSSAATA